MENPIRYHVVCNTLPSYMQKNRKLKMRKTQLRNEPGMNSGMQSKNKRPAKLSIDSTGQIKVLDLVVHNYR